MAKKRPQYAAPPRNTGVKNDPGSASYSAYDAVAGNAVESGRNSANATVWRFCGPRKARFELFAHRTGNEARHCFRYAKGTRMLKARGWIEN